MTTVESVAGAESAKPQILRTPWGIEGSAPATPTFFSSFGLRH